MAAPPTVSASSGSGPADPAKGGSVPVGQVPGGGVPVDQVPGGGAPVDQAPGGGVPVDQVPGGGAMTGPARAGGNGPVVQTPTVRSALRRGLFWIIAAVFALLVVLIGMVTIGGSTAGAPLDARDAAPAGGKAVVEVLRQQGVTVTVADTLSEAKSASSDNATVLLYDPSGYLTGDRLAEAGALGARTVMVSPDFRMLASLAPGVALAGVPGGTEPVAAKCSLPASVKAGYITAGGQTYRADGVAGAGDDVAGEGAQGDGAASSDAPSTDTAAWVTCFPENASDPEHASFSLLQRTSDSHTVTVLGNADVLKNETIIASGNAALALNLLGPTDSLVWYLPTLDDVPATGPPSLAELSPGWLPPVLGLLALVALAAALWRGRRIGPLVVEPLPVTVKANETIEGRARLYQRASARAHALDSVRIGTVSRLADRLRMSRHATVDEIAAAVADRTGRSMSEVRGILMDEQPAGDRDLMRLSDALLVLERQVAEQTEREAGAPQHGE